MRPCVQLFTYQPTCRVYLSICHTINEYNLYSLVLLYLQPVRKHRHKQVNKHNTQPLILELSLWLVKSMTQLTRWRLRSEFPKTIPPSHVKSFKYRNLKPFYCKLRRYILTNNTRYRFTLRSICLQQALLYTYYFEYLFIAYSFCICF